MGFQNGGRMNGVGRVFERTDDKMDVLGDMGYASVTASSIYCRGTPRKPLTSIYSVRYWLRRLLHYTLFFLHILVLDLAS